VILGCTEITLLFAAPDSPLPVVDTTALHAAAAVEHILGGTHPARARPLSIRT
jgi:aspartate racemase